MAAEDKDCRDSKDVIRAAVAARVLRSMLERAGLDEVERDAIETAVERLAICDCGLAIGKGHAIKG